MKSQTPVSTYLNYLIQRSSFLVFIQLVACLIIPTSTNAQNEANNWFFGNGCGVSFNSGAPVAFANSNLNSAEGVSSISDATGNVLMYTDGLSLYNQNDVVMPNGSGLLGGNSSSQSAVIIRKPLSNNLYYLFTADQDAQPDGIRYSIVDMSLNGGLGNITATKNVLLHTPATEKLTAVQHCNKRDVWIIAHGWGDANYMAWLLTPTGLTTTPVISSLGQIQDQTVIGCMKASPDGKKLAIAVYDVGGSNYVQLSDFNPATGVVSNAFQIPTPSNCYGVEFSPSSQYLYFTGGLSASSTFIAIYQADICAGSNAAVISSVTEVGNSSTGFIRTLQLGPDGKLYFTRFAQNWIGVIDNPNLAAPSCGFNVNGVQLSTGAQCKAGLANFNQSFFRQQVPFGSSSSCLNVSFNTNAINQAASCLNPIQSYSWLFGDPSTGASNISSSANPSHTYSSPGTYSVRLIINYLCSADTLFQNVTANCGPQLQVSDEIVCSGACYSLQASTVGGTPPYSYSWNSGIGSGSGPHSVCPGVTSNYIVTVTDASGLTDQDTVTVIVSSINPYTLSTNSVSCNGGSNGSALISLPGGPYTYQWTGFPSNTGTSLSNVPAGNYSFIISNQAGCHKNGSVTITQPLPITATIATHPAACSQANGSASVSVSGGVAPYSYSWLGFSQTGSLLNGVPAGNYSLTITDANNCSTTVNFSINSASGPLASVQLNSPVNCHGGNSGSLTALSSGGQAPLNYAWSNGQTTATITNLPAGTYTVTVTDANSCQSTDTYTLIDPVAISTTLVTQSATCSLANGSASINVSGAVSPIQVNWATSPAQSGTTATNLIAGNYSVLVTDANGCYASTNFTIGNLPGALVSISSTPMSCSGANDATVTVSVITSGSYQVNWNTGQTSTQLNSVGAGTYTATVTTAAGCISTVSQVISSPSPLTLNFSSSPASCGSANGSLTANVSGGFAPYTFSWAGYSSVNAANLPNLIAGSYPLTVTDSHGCTISGNASVSSLNGPSILVSNQQDPHCNGAATGSASVNVVGSALPLSVLWSNGAMGTSVSGLVAGNYSAVVTDGNGCQSSVSLSLNQPNSISSLVSTNSTTCNAANGSILLNLSGGTLPYSVNWIGPTASTGMNPSGLLAGNYSATVTDAIGCTTSVSATVGTQTPPQVSVSEIQSISCPGGNDAELTVQIAGGLAPFAVLWSTGATSSSIQSLSAGNYSTTITDASGCVTTATSVVSEPLSWSVQASLISSTCGNPNGSIQLNISGGTAPYVINWSNNQTGTFANQLLAGTYDAIITDASGCISSSSHTVSDAGGLQLSVVSQSDAQCFGSNDGSAQVQAMGGTAPYVYHWFDGFSSAQRSDLSAGTHIVTVTDANGCSASTQILISEPTILDGILSINDGTCGLANGSASIQVNGGTLPYFYTWTNSSALATIAGISTGSIGVLVTDANGCQKNFSGSVGMAPALQLTASVTQPISCFGSSTGEIQLSGGSNLTVNWSTGQTGMTLSNVSAGTYTATAQDAGGCSDTVSISISEPSALTGQLQIQDATCSLADGAASLQITGGTLPYSYSWSTSSNLSAVSGLLAGPVSVQVTDANGCQINLSGIVASEQLLQIQSIQVTDASCAGMNDGSAQATVIGAVGSVNWNWSTGSTTQFTTGIAAGSYQVEVTDAAGCSATTNFVVQEPSSLTASINTVDVSCHSLTDGQASLLVQGGTLPYSFAWDGSAGSISNNQLNAGLHQATITDQNGCSVEVDFTINQPDVLQAGIETISSVCGLANGSMNGSAIGGTSPYQYIWSTGGNQAQITGLASGSYTLQVTDAHGCQSALTKSFQDPGAPVVSLIQAQNISCFGGDDGAIEVSAQGGTGLLSLNWSDSNLLGASINGLSAGNYSLVVSDELNCKDTLVTILSQPDALISSHTIENVHCFGGTDGAAHLTINGGTQPYSFVWTSSTSMYAGQADLNQVSAGAYQVQITDAHACQIVDSITISEPELLIGSMHAQAATCYGSATGMLLSQANGGILPYEYAWSNGSQSPNADSLAAGIYSVLITDANGCGISLPGEVMQPEVLIVQFSGERALCKGDSSLLTASATGGTLPFSFNWSGGETQDQIVWNALETHEVQVIVQDSKGCTDTLKTQLLVYELPRVEVLSAQTSICAGTCAEFSAAAVPGGTYVWSDSQNMIHTGQSVSLCYDEAANVGITLQVTDEHGCVNQWTADSYLTVHPLPEIGFEAEQYTVPLLEALVHFENTTSGALSYIWDFDPRMDEQTSNDISPSYQFTEIGEYPVSLIATNEFGCSIQLQKTITVTEDFAVYFPNAFTPNNDGSNDRFIPVGVGILSTGFSMQIYNRWGNLVYETKNLSEGWDGNYESTTNQGESASEVFVWQVSLTDFKGLVRDYRGSVTLIR